jgi:hypothetical protein
VKQTTLPWNTLRLETRSWRPHYLSSFPRRMCTHACWCNGFAKRRQFYKDDPLPLRSCHWYTVKSRLLPVQHPAQNPTSQVPLLPRYAKLALNLHPTWSHHSTQPTCFSHRILFPRHISMHSDTLVVTSRLPPTMVFPSPPALTLL